MPIDPPVAEAPAPPMPLMLTAKEKKKIRKQRREEREKERQVCRPSTASAYGSAADATLEVQIKN